MDLEAWLTLLFAARPGGPSWLELLEHHGSPEAVLRLGTGTLQAAGLGPPAIERLSRPDSEVLRRWQDWLAVDGHELIPFGSSNYPRMLRELADAPLALWTWGRQLELLNAPQLALVGSRNPTSGGRATARDFAQYLSHRGLTIISGLATGIDGASHRGGLGGPGSTVAVLGSGPDEIYPRSHIELAREIGEKGLLVSEYPPGTPVLARHFPQRNRIIAGMSVGTLVIEAARRSGSLITARLAAEYGREVFAIPGSIHNPLTRGCHQLIRQGAKLVEEAGDVLVELTPLLQLEDPERDEHSVQGYSEPRVNDPQYDKLLNAMGFEPTTLGNLTERTGLTTAELSSMLLLLELEGYIEALPGARYSRQPKRSP